MLCRIDISGVGVDAFEFDSKLRLLTFGPLPHFFELGRRQFTRQHGQGVYFNQRPVLVADGVKMGRIVVVVVDVNFDAVEKVQHDYGEF